MNEDIQGILERINREGIEKADARAAEIIADAEAKAAKLIADAKAAADMARADAEKSAAEYASRAEETIRQAARDTVLAIESAITAKLESLLAENVDKALADETTLVKLVTDAIAALGGDAEVSVGAKLVPALKAALASRPAIKIITDEASESGFSIRTDSGRVEHDFHGTAIATELARRLRSDLAKLVK